MDGKVFKDIQPGDIPLTLEMRVGETVRQMLAKMTFSAGEMTEALDKGFQEAVKEINLGPLIKEKALKVINEEVDAYFSYGRGAQLIRGGVMESLERLFPEEKK